MSLNTPWRIRSIAREVRWDESLAPNASSAAGASRKQRSGVPSSATGRMDRRSLRRNPPRWAGSGAGHLGRGRWVMGSAGCWSRDRCTPWALGNCWTTRPWASTEARRPWRDRLRTFPPWPHDLARPCGRFHGRRRDRGAAAGVRRVRAIRTAGYALLAGKGSSFGRRAYS